MKRYSLGIAFAALLATQTARAGGLYYSDRGVRPLGRGGAFVAGADDAGGIWYNPAGLAGAGTSLLVDASWLNFSSEFQRRMQVVDASGAVRTFESPAVSGSTPFLPIPTLAGTYNFGKKHEYTVGLGVYAPYVPILSYPLAQDGQPAASRYSLVTAEGSALAIVHGAFAYRPTRFFQVGIGLQVLGGTYRSQVVFSANPADRLIGAPEDPQFDTLSQLNVSPIVAPSGNLGIIVRPVKAWRIGLSGQAPFFVNAPATVSVRLPRAPEFDRAYQDGKDARVKFMLPPILRLGVEYRPVMTDGKQPLRVELAYVREFWSLHKTIDIESKNIKLYDITGFPSPFGVAPISVPRYFEDSNSFRLGGEYTLRAGARRLDVRAGAAFETSAVPKAYMSPLTVDSDKLTLAVGAGFHVSPSLRVDAVLARVFGFDVDVSPAEARVPRISPVKGNPTATEAINGGKYSAGANIVGFGANVRF